MSDTSFRESFTELTPSWLNREDGEKVLFSLTALIDLYAQRAYEALLARMPSFCPPDGLGKLGRDRRVVRGIAESRESFVNRLLRSKTALKKRGTAFEIIRQIRAYINQPVMVRVVDVSGNWYTIDAEGTEIFQPHLGNWNWDGDTSNKAKLWVIIYSPNSEPWAERVWDDAGNWGDENHYWGGTFLDNQIQDIVNLAVDWAPQGAIVSHVIISYWDGDSLFNPLDSSTLPDGTWGKQYKYENGVAVASRSENAAYVEVMR